jgi:hypothetical protein
MKTYSIINNTNVHEYTLIVKESTEHTGSTEYILKTSNEDIWSNPSKDHILISMIDTGNGFELDNPVPLSLGYDAFGELYILLSAIKNIDINLMPNYKLVELQEPIDI